MSKFLDSMVNVFLMIQLVATVAGIGAFAWIVFKFLDAFSKFHAG